MKSITKRENGTLRVQTMSDKPSKTEQSHRNSSNINRIMEKYHATGFINRPNKEAKYGDFTSLEDFHSVQNRIIEARCEFLKLPATMRRRFNNDPGQLIEFINDPENADECVALGLIEKMESDLTKEQNDHAKAPDETQEESEGDIST